MLQRSRQHRELDQTLDSEPVGLPSGRPVGPGERQRHSPGRAALADEHPPGPRPVLLEDYDQALTEQRVERVGDDDRVRKRARLGNTGAMRAPSGCRDGGAFPTLSVSAVPAQVTAGTAKP